MSLIETERWFALHRETPVSAEFEDLVAAVHDKLAMLRLCEQAEARPACNEQLRTLYRRVAGRDRRSLDELLHVLASRIDDQRVHSIFADRPGEDPLPRA